MANGTPLGKLEATARPRFAGPTAYSFGAVSRSEWNERAVSEASCRADERLVL